MFYHAGTVIFSNGFLYIFQSDPMSVCFLSFVVMYLFPTITGVTENVFATDRTIWCSSFTNFIFMIGFRTAHMLLSHYLINLTISEQYPHLLFSNPTGHLPLQQIQCLFPLSPDTLSLILHWQLHYLYQWNLCAAWFHDCIASDNDWSRLLCFHWLTLQWVQAGFYTHVLFFLFIIIFWNRPVHSGFIFNPLQQ